MATMKDSLKTLVKSFKKSTAPELPGVTKQKKVQEAAKKVSEEIKAEKG